MLFRSNETVGASRLSFFHDRNVRSCAIASARRNGRPAERGQTSIVKIRICFTNNTGALHRRSTWRASTILIQPLRPPTTASVSSKTRKILVRFILSFRHNAATTSLVLLRPDDVILRNHFSLQQNLYATFPVLPHVFFPTPTSVVLAILSRLQGVDPLLDRNLLVIPASSNTVPVGRRPLSG